jgi:hypothetical protein
VKNIAGIGTKSQLLAEKNVEPYGTKTNVQ